MSTVTVTGFSTFYGSSGTLYCTPLSPTYTMSSSNFVWASYPPTYPEPYNVVCSKCGAHVGIRCKTPAKYEQRWKKGRGEQKWFSAREQACIPHRERIIAGKIQAVTDKLDGMGV